MNRKYSLKKNYDIEKLIKIKQSVGNKNYVVYYQKLNDYDLPQIAISASKKLGKAVERNYQKRIIREIMRPWLNTLNGYKCLIVIKKASMDLRFTEKKQELEQLIQRMKHKEIKK